MSQSSLIPTNAAIILVSPQMGENIGAVARVMGNFGFRDLRLVNPRDDWPNPKAVAVASNASEIVDNALLYDNLTDALEGCDLVFACSARMRNINIKNETVKEHVKNLATDFAGEKIAILFGSERCGLLNEEIILASRIINIEADACYPVLNLAQAASIILYEYHANFSASGGKSYQKIHKHNHAEIKDVNAMIERLDKDLGETNFYKDEERRVKMKQNILNIFTRINLSKTEVKTLSGVFKYLYKYKGK